MINQAQWPIRVLIVDDDPFAARSLRQLLEDHGLIVSTAASPDEARESMREMRFHVAILDKKLDETRDDNEDGILLMTEFHELDPAMAIIMLTAWATVSSQSKALLQQIADREVFQVWRSPARYYLEKTPENLKDIPQRVKAAFQEVSGVNVSMVIDYPPYFLPQAAERLRFTELHKPELRALQDEINELLRMLFREWDGINLMPLDSIVNGHSKALVFRVQPHRRDREGEITIAKIGEVGLMRREIYNYRSYVRGIAGGHFVPAAMEPAWRTRSLGGVVYTYAGIGGGVQDFEQFYDDHEAHAICGALESLFRATLRWIPAPNAERVVNLSAIYYPRLRLQEDELEQVRRRIVEGDFICRVRGGTGLLDQRGRRLTIGGVNMPDPVAYAFSVQMYAVSAEAVAHGDLHIRNVLIDHQNNCWLIDFANTEPHPGWFDYVYLETSVRVELVRLQDPRLLDQWNEFLFQQDDLSIPELSSVLATHPELVKATMVVRKLREVAFAENGRGDRRAYAIGLFFTALRMTTVKFLEFDQYRHAFMAAARIADWLERHPASSSVYPSGGM